MMKKKITNWIYKIFVQDRMIKLPPYFVEKVVVKTKAISVVGDYSLTVGKIYDVKFDKSMYNDGSFHVSWYEFTADNGSSQRCHNHKFKILSEYRDEQLNSILEDDTL